MMTNLNMFLIYFGIEIGKNYILINVTIPYVYLSIIKILMVFFVFIVLINNN